MSPLVRSQQSPAGPFLTRIGGNLHSGRKHKKTMTTSHNMFHEQQKDSDQLLSRQSLRMSYKPIPPDGRGENMPDNRARLHHTRAGQGDLVVNQHAC